MLEEGDGRGLSAPAGWGPQRTDLIAQLGGIADDMRRMEHARAGDLERVHPDRRRDAQNLIHYLALRRRDLRPVQRMLAERGLSSLGRCEPHVQATVLAAEAAARGERPRPPPGGITFAEGRAALDANTDALLGHRPKGRVPRIMVTLPTEAGSDYAMVRRFVELGMDVARINGAHDDPEVWERMADHVARASVETGRPCRVSVDLPGPKLRTGALVDGPAVVRVRPRRDARGIAVVPASAVLAAGTDRAGVIPVDGGWVARRRPGDVVDLFDTRGAARHLLVQEAGSGRCVVEVWDTTYVETGAALDCRGDIAAVGPLPRGAQAHTLRVGDPLWLVHDDSPATPWYPGAPGAARIGCSLPAVFTAAAVGDRVLLDDGKIGGVVEAIDASGICVRVLDAPPAGARLRAEKGINLPDTDLGVPIISDADEPLLDLATRRADMLAVSFLHHERDVDLVRDVLQARRRDDIGLVLKIETGAAFERLPELLLHAMRSPRVGVMIARGDLAVEGSFERLAEVQEEVLWLSEAAHLPVIWATEVLDQLARTGRPSRAEVTDAAMAQRAECVMLNKGPYIDAAIAVLDDILRRMSGHQRKKTSLLRPLRSWVADP